MNDNKKLEFFKGKILEQLNIIKDDIPELRWNLWVNSVEMCDDYEALREMAELDMQLDMFRYTKNEISPKLERLNMDIDSIRSNAVSERSIGTDIDKINAQVDDYTTDEMISDLEDPEIDAAMASILLTRFASTPEEELNREELLDSVNDIRPSIDDLDNMDGELEGLGDIGSDAEIGEEDFDDEFSDDDLVSGDEDDSDEDDSDEDDSDEDDSDEDDSDEDDLDAFGDDFDDESGNSDDSFDDMSELEGFDDDADDSDSEFDDMSDLEDLGDFEESDGEDDDDFDPFDNNLADYADLADDSENSDDNDDDDDFDPFDMDIGDLEGTDNDADDSDSEFDDMSDLEGLDDLDEQDESDDIDDDLDSMFDSDSDGDEDGDEFGDMDDLIDEDDDPFSDSDDSDDSDDEDDSLENMFSDMDDEDEDRIEDISDDMDFSDFDSDDPFSNLGSDESSFGELANAGDILSSGDGFDDMDDSAFGDFDDADDEASDKQDKDDDPFGDLDDMGDFGDFGEDSAIDDDSDEFFNESSRKDSKNETKSVNGQINKNSRPDGRQISPDKIFINGTDKGVKTQNMFNAITKAGSMLSKFSKGAIKKTNTAINNGANRLTQSELFNRDLED